MIVYRVEKISYCQSGSRFYINLLRDHKIYQDKEMIYHHKKAVEGVTESSKDNKLFFFIDLSLLKLLI